jgi:hypothetical protein
MNGDVEVIPFDSGPLEDEETAKAADDILRMLDAEEGGGKGSGNKL